MQISSLDLKYLCKEIQTLIGARITKIYQPKKEVLLFQCHIPSKGKQSLGINIPFAVYLTTERSPQIEPSAYCKKLRTLLQGGRIKTIEQQGFERILKISVEIKTTTFHCMIELFGKGNFIVCDHNMIILLPLSGKTWKDRILRKAQPYELPPQRVNVFMLTLSQLQQLIKESRQTSIVKTLATNCGLGGKYAEECCALAALDKNKETLTPTETKKLYEVIRTYVIPLFDYKLL